MRNLDAHQTGRFPLYNVVKFLGLEWCRLAKGIYTT